VAVVPESVAEPIKEAPSWNETIPVALRETDAVSITPLPNVEGLGLAAKTAVELALLTVSVTALLVEPSVLESPEYTAVIV
jgi:hypothetical protein